MLARFEDAGADSSPSTWAVAYADHVARCSGGDSNHAAHEWAAHGLSDVCHDVKSALGVGVQILTDPSVLVSLPKGGDGRPADVGLFGYGGIRGNTVAVDTTIAPILGVSSSDPTTALRAADTDDVMGVGEDPVGEDGMDIDAPAWPPADVEAADEGVIREGDPGDFYMKVIAKKFRGIWHYGVITGVVTEWVLEDYGGATQWRAVFEDGDIVDLLRSEGHIGFRAMKQEDRRQALVPIPSNFGRGLRPSFAVSKKSKGSGKVTVQSGWVMEDCLHHMETFFILNAGPLFEEARVKAIMTEKELASPELQLLAYSTKYYNPSGLGTRTASPRRHRKT
eukprot:jgi/Tetstr1/462336/TSEL_007342.t1